MQKFFASLYRISNWLVVIGVVTQLFLVGLVVVARQLGWDPHATVGHLIFLPILLMVISMYVAKFGKEIKRPTWILLLTYFIQADILIFLRTSTSVPALYLAALHPVLALAVFWLSVKLLRMPKAAAA